VPQGVPCVAHAGPSHRLVQFLRSADGVVG
jgi:hypothetical protein